MSRVNYYLNRSALAYAATILAVLLGTSQLNAQEGISVREGAYEVFYSAFNTSFLTPEVASATGVVRAKNRGLLNVSVIKHLPDGSSSPIAAKNISGETFDLLHRRTLEFREIIETDAHYYLAPFKITNDNELIVITVEVTPIDSEKSIALKFERRFFHN